MGATLNLAVEKQAYALTDRATWLSFGNQQTHDILLEGDERLFNQYGVIPVAKSACPASRQDLAMIFADWLTSEKGQSAIESFTMADQVLFTPNAE